jgi:hypothetical protein
VCVEHADGFCFDVLHRRKIQEQKEKKEGVLTLFESLESVGKERKEGKKTSFVRFR